MRGILQLVFPSSATTLSKIDIFSCNLLFGNAEINVSFLIIYLGRSPKACLVEQRY